MCPQKQMHEKPKYSLFQKWLTVFCRYWTSNWYVQKNIKHTLKALFSHCCKFTLSLSGLCVFVLTISDELEHLGMA